MENPDPPPPYPELEAGDRFTHLDGEQTSTVLPPVEKDLATHPHEHVLLATTSNVFPAAIHFWTRAEENSPTYSLRSVQTRLGPDSLALVQGFRQLGECHLRDPLINRHETVARFLESIVASTPAAAASDSEGVLAWIQKRLATLGTIQENSLAPQEPTAAAVKVVAIPVFSNSRDPLFTGGPHAIWKWVKPSSLYRKSGAWELRIDDALTDGEWSAGKGLQLLVGGISSEEKESFGTGKKIG